MIELKYKDIGVTKLVPVLQKLNQMSVFDGRTAYRLHKIATRVFDEFNKTSMVYLEIGKKYAQKDEKGELVRDERMHYVPEAEKVDEYKAEVDKFFNQTFKIEQHKIHVDALSVRLSPDEMFALAPILEGLEEVA